MTITLSCFKLPLTRTYALATIGAAIRVPGSTEIKSCDGPPIATRFNGGPCRAVRKNGGPWNAAKLTPDGHPKTNDKGPWRPCINSFLCYLANVGISAYVLCRVK